jgi:methylmalonyl-CoA/ethylmalonyl-CoA epimerase
MATLIFAFETFVDSQSQQLQTAVSTLIDREPEPTNTSVPLTGFRFHHIGLACRDVEKEARALRLLGYELEGQHFMDPLQKIHGCFLVGLGPRMELLAPVDESSPIVSWLNKDAKMYHQAYEVASIDAALKALRTQHAVVVSRPKPAVAFGDRKVAFLLLPNSLLIELIECPGLQDATQGPAR